MKTMKWAQRICIGSSIAVASLFAVPAVAGADCNSYTGTGCTTPTVQNTSVVPPSTSTSAGTSTTAVNGSSSLPFTGADIGELAVVGVGAVVLGGVLARRRRSAA